MIDHEHKYKALRSAHMEMVNIYAREKKLAAKDRQRIISLCYVGLDPINAELVGKCFEKILGVLKVSGYGGAI